MPTIHPRRTLASLGLAWAVLLCGGSGTWATVEFSLDRLEGANRWETSALVAAEFAGGDTAIVVNGQNGSYADALSASYLAGVLGAPVLLTSTLSTPEPVLEQLERDDVTNIVVVGGESRVSPAQVRALEDAGYAVERVSGANRYRTNAEVIAAGGQATDGLGIIATGQDFADALAGGPLAFHGHPLGLARRDSIAPSVLTALKEAGVDSVYVLGGHAAVSDTVVEALSGQGIEVRNRLSGQNRSETAVAVAEELVDQHGFVADSVIIASGATALHGVDALSGGPLAGQAELPLLVTRSGDDPGAVRAFLKDRCPTLTHGFVLGGAAAVSTRSMADMGAWGKSCETGDEAAPVLTDARAVAEGPVITATVVATDDVGITAVTARLAAVDGRVIATQPATGGLSDLYSAVFTAVPEGSYQVTFVATDAAVNYMWAVTPPVDVLGPPGAEN